MLLEDNFLKTIKFYIISYTNPDNQLSCLFLINSNNKEIFFVVINIIATLQNRIKTATG